MIVLKNRTREPKVYQYPRDVSAGPVRPQVMQVVRGHLNPKTGEKTSRNVEITLGGTLTIPPGGTVTSLPEVLLQHKGLQRDIKARHVLKKDVKTSKVASAAPVETKSSKPRVRKGK